MTTERRATQWKTNSGCGRNGLDSCWNGNLIGRGGGTILRTSEGAIPSTKCATLRVGLTICRLVLQCPRYTKDLAAGVGRREDTRLDKDKVLKRRGSRSLAETSWTKVKQATERLTTPCMDDLELGQATITSDDQYIVHREQPSPEVHHG
jgi:hypothetical protein